mgnify:CR=1 FL=1
MGVIYCPECQQEVSEYAKACPHCGFGVSDFMKEHNLIDIENNKAFVCPKCAQIYFGKEYMSNPLHVRCEYCGTVVKEILDKSANEFQNYFFSKGMSDKWDDIMIDYAQKYGDNQFDINEFHNSRNKIYEYNMSKRNNSLSQQPTQNVPKCPTCGSLNVKPISGVERTASVGFFGLFSKKINKSYKCGNCGYTW